MFSKIDTLYSDLSEYFVFDKTKYSVEEFLSDIKIFKDQFLVRMLLYAVIICNLVFTHADNFGEIAASIQG
jgi:hypothetical protein